MQRNAGRTACGVKRTRLHPPWDRVRGWRLARWAMVFHNVNKGEPRPNKIAASLAKLLDTMRIPKKALAWRVRKSGLENGWADGEKAGIEVATRGRSERT